MNHHHHHEDTHIENHPKTYLEWSKKADIEVLKHVVSYLEKASELTMSINKLSNEVMKKIY